MHMSAPWPIHFRHSLRQRKSAENDNHLNFRRHLSQGFLRTLAYAFAFVALCAPVAEAAGKGADSVRTSRSLESTTSISAPVGDCTPGLDWPAANASYASRVVELVNQHRAGLGLLALKVSPTLTNSAVWKARHMWLNSPDHRSNMESSSWKVIGVGAAASTSGSYWRL